MQLLKLKKEVTERVGYADVCLWMDWLLIQVNLKFFILMFHSCIYITFRENQISLCKINLPIQIVSVIRLKLTCFLLSCFPLNIELKYCYEAWYLLCSRSSTRSRFMSALCLVRNERFQAAVCGGITLKFAPWPVNAPVISSLRLDVQSKLSCRARSFDFLGYASCNFHAERVDVIGLIGCTRRRCGQRPCVSTFLVNIRD